MRIRTKFDALGDELAVTAIVRELRRQRPQEMIRPEVHRTEIFDNNPHINIGINDVGRHFLEVHVNEDIGNIPQSFARQIGMDPLVDDTPEIFLRQEERLRAMNKLKGLDRPIVAIDTRAQWESRTWPHEKFQTLVDMMEDVSFVEVGSVPPESRRILKNTKACFVNACTIRESAALLYWCDLFVGNDSGGFHLAAAVETPQVVLFGPKKWYSRGYWNTTPVYSFERCNPNCESLCARRREGREGTEDNWCLGKVKPERVKEAIYLAMRRFQRP